jgi:hypothetical protein
MYKILLSDKSNCKTYMETKLRFSERDVTHLLNFYLPRESPPWISRGTAEHHMGWGLWKTLGKSWHTPHIKVVLKESIPCQWGSPPPRHTGHWHHCAGMKWNCQSARILIWAGNWSQLLRLPPSMGNINWLLWISMTCVRTICFTFQCSCSIRISG